jgi:hypothetical protein
MYLQSQDGNVYRSEARAGGDELQGMRPFLRRDVTWMKEAVGQFPLPSFAPPPSLQMGIIGSLVATS